MTGTVDQTIRYGELLRDVMEFEALTQTEKMAALGRGKYSHLEMAKRAIALLDEILGPSTEMPAEMRVYQGWGWRCYRCSDADGEYLSEEAATRASKEHWAECLSDGMTEAVAQAWYEGGGDDAGDA
jgi:hypothetical protein